MGLWKKATTTITAAHAIQEKGGVQKDDLRYNPQTRIRQPSDTPPPHAQQHVLHGYGESASYFNDPPQDQSPFVQGTSSAPSQQGSPQPQAYTYNPSQPGYNWQQNQPSAYNARPPAQGFPQSQPGAQHPNYTMSEQPRTFEAPNAWTAQTYHVHSSPPPTLDQWSHTPQRSATQVWHSQDSAPSLQPRSQTMPASVHNCHDYWNSVLNRCMWCEPENSVYQETVVVEERPWRGSA